MPDVGLPQLDRDIWLSIRTRCSPFVVRSAGAIRCSPFGPPLVVRLEGTRISDVCCSCTYMLEMVFWLMDKELEMHRVIIEPTKRSFVFTVHWKSSGPPHSHGTPTTVTQPQPVNGGSER
ncbi:hypothetical protein K1719_002532 [Acacia pycnantha]|nr:hypothetical protein K1719_002532 [Acacia pycnantha]